MMMMMNRFPYLIRDHEHRVLEMVAIAVTNPVWKEQLNEIYIDDSFRRAATYNKVKFFRIGNHGRMFYSYGKVRGAENYLDAMNGAPPSFTSTQGTRWVHDVCWTPDGRPVDLVRSGL